MTTKPLRIALTKGRLEKDTVALMERVGLDCQSLHQKGRRLILREQKWSGPRPQTLSPMWKAASAIWESWGKTPFRSLPAIYMSCWIWDLDGAGSPWR